MARAMVAETSSQAARMNPGGIARTKVLFVCVGNSCRSQMAEAIARHFVPHVMDCESAGTNPFHRVAPETMAVLQEKGIRAEGHYSKGIGEVLTFFEPDIVVNMSGYRLNGFFPGAEILEWRIEDPFGSEPKVYQRIYDQLKKKIKKLASDLRKRKNA